MAKKVKPADETKKTVVRRVKASDDKKPAKKTTPTKKAVTAKGGDKPKKKGLLSSFFGYFTGAWHELRQVRWPSRRATWGMTGALLAFTGIFIGFILVIDLVFENLFKLILGN